MSTYPWRRRDRGEDNHLCVCVLVATRMVEGSRWLEFVFSAQLSFVGAADLRLLETRVGKGRLQSADGDCVCRRVGTARAGASNAVGYTEHCWPDLWLLKWRAEPRSRCANIRQSRYDKSQYCDFQGEAATAVLVYQKSRVAAAAWSCRNPYGQVMGWGFSSVMGFETMLTNLSGSGCFRDSRPHPDILSF